MDKYRTNYWHECLFEDFEVEQIKQKWAVKNKLLGEHNRYSKNFDTRFCGDLGELAFLDYVNSFGVIPEHRTKDDDFDDWDFTLGSLKIDVKTISTNYYPKPYYGCDVVEFQVNKMMKPENPINALVFARYLKEENRVVVLGWLFKDEFLQKAEYQEAGTVLHKLTISTNQYEVKISDLRPLITLFEYR